MPIEAKSTPKAPSNNDFANMFVKQPYEIVDNIRPIPSASKPLTVSEDSYPLSGSKRGSDNFKIIAYILLIIGVLSIIGKILGS